MPAGLMPVRSSGPPKSQGGPLSYLSTVTTASTSDWGSQSLDNLSKQPSDVAAASSGNPVASADARAASSIATSSGQRGGNGDARQELGRKLSSADQSSAHQGRSNSRSSSASAEASGRVSVSSTSQAQGADLYSKPPSTASEAEAEVSGKASVSAAMRPAGLKQMPLAAPSGRQSQSQEPNANGAMTSDPATSDWSAFGGAARNEAKHGEPQNAAASQTASAHQSGHALPVPGTSQAFAAQDEWSAFGEASTAAAHFDSSTKEAAEADAGFDNTNPFLDPRQAPRQQVAQAGVGLGNTNPFLEPGQDSWQHGTRAAPADSAAVARTASGDSFGDFNAPGEREDGFEVAAWDAAAKPEDKTDRIAGAASADPFAASASFTDFAALLDPTQTDVLGGLDTMASVKASPQGPSAAQFGLSEQQDAQTSEQLQGFANQVSGVLFGRVDATWHCTMQCPHTLALSLCRASANIC